MSTSRRSFLKTSLAATALSATGLSTPSLFASPLGLPLGLQLYSLRDQLPTDYLGTLKQVGALGYKEVEAAGFFHHTAAEVKADMVTANLHCVSAHYPWTTLNPDLDNIIEFHTTLGAEYIICASPGYKNPAPDGHNPAMTMDDWHWNAEQFNRVGAKVKAAGLRFGYHNHIHEFDAKAGLVPYDELIRLTDPNLVTFEMDCGWVLVGGGDPVAYLKKYPHRISMLHLKDFLPRSPGAPTVPTELGRGTTDFHPIFAAAKGADIKHAFIEQEGFDVPPMESLKIDAAYFNNLSV